MKTLRYLAIGIAAFCLASCSNDEPDNLLTFTPSDYNISYNADGVWADCMDGSVGDFTYGGFTFTHAAQPQYSYWYGFSPSRAKNDGVGDLEHQWTAVTGGGVAGKGTPYMIGYYSAYGVDGYACAITRDGKLFRPMSISVTNTAYVYNCIKEGTPYNKKFEAGDWLKLIITGYAQGGEVGKVEALLADGADILAKWQSVDLSGLGYVEGLVFTMDSSDTGEWGINTPTYFAFDRLSYELAE